MPSEAEVCGGSPGPSGWRVRSCRLAPTDRMTSTSAGSIPKGGTSESSGRARRCPKTAASSHVRHRPETPGAQHPPAAQTGRVDVGQLRNQGLAGHAWRRTSSATARPSWTNGWDAATFPSLVAESGFHVGRGERVGSQKTNGQEEWLWCSPVALDELSGDVGQCPTDRRGAISTGRRCTRCQQ